MSNKISYFLCPNQTPINTYWSNFLLSTPGMHCSKGRYVMSARKCRGGFLTDAIGQRFTHVARVAALSQGQEGDKDTTAISYGIFYSAKWNVHGGQSILFHWHQLWESRVWNCYHLSEQWNLNRVTKANQMYENLFSKGINNYLEFITT